MIIKFPEKSSWRIRNKILDHLAVTNRLKIEFKPYEKGHWWDIGISCENMLLYLIKKDSCKIRVYLDNKFMQYWCTLEQDKGLLSTDTIKMKFYNLSQFSTQKEIEDVYRLILGVPYHYFVIEKQVRKAENPLCKRWRAYNK